jgi:hypothetical protein
MENYSTDDLITELRKRDEGYFVSIIPKEYAIDRLGKKNTEEYLQDIQEMFMESPHITDVFGYVLNDVEEMYDLVKAD